MKTIMVFALSILWSFPAFAETRIMGVWVQKTTKGVVQVAISSDVEAENRTNLTIPEAKVILQNAEGWGSSVIVGVQVRGIGLAEYLPLLKAISENVWLDLAFVEGRPPDAINDNIKKRIEQQGGGYSPPAARSPKPTP